MKRMPVAVLAALLLACGPALAQAPFGPATAVLTGKRPKVCLVLSGGGARGAAHVGVLRALEALRVPIDCIAGTSMGALVGAGYASGMSVDAMAKSLVTKQRDAVNAYGLQGVNL